MQPDFDSHFECNRLMWFTSLPNNELGPSRRIREDLASWANDADLEFQHVLVESPSHLFALLTKLENECKEKGTKPIVHFDMHGDAKRGLYISEKSEFISWKVLISYFQKINFAAKNNLAVVLAACYGLNAITPIRLDNNVPFFLLLAPHKEVTVGYLEDKLLKFYKSIFTGLSVDSAYEEFLSEHFTYIHCEKLLFQAIDSYIKTSCIGASARAKRERLLTEIINNGLPHTMTSLKDAREKIKSGMLPSKEMLDKYVSTFLIGKECSFTIDDFYARYNIKKINNAA